MHSLTMLPECDRAGWVNWDKLDLPLYSDTSLGSFVNSPSISNLLTLTGVSTEFAPRLPVAFSKSWANFLWDRNMPYWDLDT